MIFYPMITMSISVARTAFVVIATVIPVFFVVVFFSVSSRTKIAHQFINRDQRRAVNRAQKYLARAYRASFIFIFANRAYDLHRLFTNAIDALNLISEQQDLGTAVEHVRFAILNTTRMPAVINSNTTNFTTSDLRQLRKSLGAAAHYLDLLNASMPLPRLQSSTVTLYLSYMVAVLGGELASLQGIITPSTSDWTWAVSGFSLQLLLAVNSAVEQTLEFGSSGLLKAGILTGVLIVIMAVTFHFTAITVK